MMGTFFTDTGSDFAISKVCLFIRLLDGGLSTLYSTISGKLQKDETRPGIEFCLL